MAFPTVTGSGYSAVAAFTHYLTLPSTVAGDLVIVSAWGEQDRQTTWVLDGSSTAFTQLAKIGTCVVKYRKMASGDGTTLTINTSNTAIRATILKIPAGTWHGTTPPEMAGIATGVTKEADPPSLSPSWGSADNLWIATGRGVTRITTPTGYTMFSVYDSISSGWKNAAAASEDPSKFTFNGFGFNIGITMAVRPVPPPSSFLMLEDGSGAYELEDDSGGLALETIA